MKIAVVIARILLGLPFLVFGLNHFLGFLADAGEHSEEGARFLEALTDSRYLFPVAKVCEVFSGACLLSGRFMPLGLIVLTPVLVNIVGYHMFLDTQGLPMAGFLVLLHGFLTWAYWTHFKGVLVGSAKPLGV